jgi:hypothetical protein
MTSTGGRPTCSKPNGTSTGGNHRSHCASSPGWYSVRTPDPAAETADATARRVRRTPTGRAPSRLAPGSPKSTSPGTPPTTPGSRARPHPPASPTPPARIAAAHAKPRPSYRVLQDPQPASDGPDRHPLSPVQPANLRPIIHVQHLMIVMGGSNFDRNRWVSLQPEATNRSLRPGAWPTFPRFRDTDHHWEMRAGSCAERIRGSGASPRHGRGSTRHQKWCSASAIRCDRAEAHAAKGRQHACWWARR